MPQILTLTMNPALDIATETERVIPTEKLRCAEPRYDPGGGGINVARAVHMLGGDAAAILPVGGLSGQMLADLLRAEQVPPHYSSDPGDYAREPRRLRAPDRQAIPLHPPGAVYRSL